MWLIGFAPPPLPAADETASAPAAAATEQFKLTADLMLGQPPLLTARGNAKLVSGEWTLTADEIRFNYDTNQADAKGHVLVTRPGLRLLSDTASYWTKERRIEVAGFRFGQPPYYFAGERAHGDATNLNCENVEIFYGEPAPLTPRASAHHLTLHGDKTFSAESLRFTVGRFPLFGFSGISRSLSRPNVDWETRAGYDGNVGLHLGAGFYVPWRPTFSPGGSLDFFSKRGMMFGPGARYGKEDEAKNETLKGAFDVAYISDRGNTAEDVLGRPIAPSRSFGTWRHQQRGGDRWTLNGAMDWWSDSDVMRDFRSRDFENNQEPDNFVEGSWYGANTVFSALARTRLNDFQIVQERLPELRADLLPLPLAQTGVLLEAEASATALREKPQGNNDASGRRSDRIDTYLALSRTFKEKAGTTFTPVLGGRVTHYFDAEGGRDTYTRWLGEVGFDARMRAFRTWDLKKPLWGIDGIRHVVEPYVSYRYVPEADRGRAFIPDIDRPAFLTQLQPLGLAGRRDIDSLGEIDVVRVGVTNLFETRRADYGSRRVVRLDFGADVHFDDSHSGNRVEDVHTELNLTPADWLEWWFFLRVDPDAPNVQEFNSRFTIVDGRSWSGGLGVDYLRDDISQLLVFGRYALSEANQVLAAVRYDGKASRFNDIEFGFIHRLHQNWEIGCRIHLRDGQRREGDFGVRLDLRFLDF